MTTKAPIITTPPPPQTFIQYSSDIKKIYIDNDINVDSDYL